jgi:hypothetical protein
MKGCSLTRSRRRQRRSQRRECAKGLSVVEGACSHDEVDKKGFHRRRGERKGVIAKDEVPIK